MANHDYSIANQSFPSFRTDLNNALAAIASTNSGTSAPSTTFANQIWYDSSANILYIRNEDNDANIPLLQLDQSGDVAATLATIIDVLDKSGTNTAGQDLTIRAGAGTGTGAGGNIILQTANAGSSGSSVNSHATAVTIDDAANCGIGTTEISDATLSILGKASGGVNGHCIQLGGDSGAGNQGGIISFRQKGDSSQRVTSFVGFAGFDNGSTRQLYYGGGGWGIENATIHAFYTNPSYDAGISASLERMRIASDGTLMIGQSNDSSSSTGHIFTPEGSAFHIRDNSIPLVLNRLSTDGTLLDLRQASTSEGTISVSGSTVSYNGGHLSRWSQLSDATKDTSIVKGTVMTNLDKMAVWAHDAVAATYYTDDDELPKGVSVGDEKTPAVDAFTENNEQLNCMAVSSAEGDTNVAGVFVNWDNDDDQFNDMNVAMTGDMVIRIAKGTTIARGDLLMSAGDGTAKTQDDDIVRSKTIAKVTSINVSHTYDDGSYLVPCVLMAC